MLTREGRQLIVNRYNMWSETWALTYAFAITQSIEKAEQVVSESMVAMIATDLPRAVENSKKRSKSSKSAKSNDDLPGSVHAVRFAATIWEASQKDAFRGYGADTFFKMTAVTRAVVILKTRAHFARTQIASALHLTVDQVDDHLENGRLLFTAGKPWLSASPGMQVEDKAWFPDCPYWKRDTTVDIQKLFANYLEKDLGSDSETKLHGHFVVCDTCRKSLVQFKENYQKWTSSFPVFEPDEDTRRHLRKVSRMATMRTRFNGPSVIPGIKKTLNKANVQAVLFGLISILFILHAIFRDR